MEIAYEMLILLQDALSKNRTRPCPANILAFNPRFSVKLGKAQSKTFVSAKHVNLKNDKLPF